MTNPFDYKNRKTAIDWRNIDKDAQRGRSVTKVVERKRAEGIEPMRLHLNPNAHNLLLGRVEK